MWVNNNFMSKSLRRLRTIELRMHPLERRLFVLKELKAIYDMQYKTSVLLRNRTRQSELDRVLCMISGRISMLFAKLKPLQDKYNELQSYMQGKFIAQAA